MTRICNASVAGGARKASDLMFNAAGPARRPASRRPRSRWLAGACASFLLAGAARAEGTLQLPLGDPARREASVALQLDRIVDTRRGDAISAEEMAARLAGVRLVFFGESHTNFDFHRAQAQLIRLLHEQGREVLVGLEMFPYTRQAELDRWTAGDYSEAEFLEAADWYGSWGYHWHYYADIFRYARDHRLTMIAINAPRATVKAVRSEGFEALREEDQAHMPPAVRFGNEEHQRLFRASFESGDLVHAQLSEAQLTGMLRAQATWDAVMGWNAMRGLEQRGGPDAIMVVLIGAGHVTYGLGSQWQIEDEFSGRIASVVPVPLITADGEPVTRVQASYADFIWGLPASRAPEFPQLGVSLAGRIGSQPTRVIQVGKRTPAAAAGLQVGDLLQDIDGEAIESFAALRRIMAGHDWGEDLEVGFEREGRLQRLRVPLRRQPVATTPRTAD